MSDATSRLIDSLPPEAAELGPPERIHPALTSIAAPTGLAILLAGLLVLGFGAILVYSGLYAPMQNATPEGLVGGGVFCLVLGVWLVSSGLGYRPASMKQGNAGAGYIVFEDGLAFLDGSRCRIVHWGDVEELQNPGGRGDYRLATREGFTVPIEHSVRQYDRLIATVFDQVTGHLVPRFYRAVEEGETVAFGPFMVSREGLGYQGVTLLWPELGFFRIVVTRGMGRRLQVRSKSGLADWCLVPIDPVPSSEAFLQLIQKIHEVWMLDSRGPLFVR